MNPRAVCRELLDKFLYTVNKLGGMEKQPLDWGVGFKLYHSEVHMLAAIGDHRGMNVTGLAGRFGVTKGAVSQIITRLEGKGLVRRYQEEGNNKEVLTGLTEDGKKVYRVHKRLHQMIDGPIIAEMEKLSPDRIEFLQYIFDWIVHYVDQKVGELPDLLKKSQETVDEASDAASEEVADEVLDNEGE